MEKPFAGSCNLVLMPFDLSFKHARFIAIYVKKDHTNVVPFGSFHFLIRQLIYSQIIKDSANGVPLVDPCLVDRELVWPHTSESYS